MTRRLGFFIYGWLVGLTLAEVAIVSMGLSKPVGAILMTATTAAKVLMIAVHFMHLKNDRPIAWLLPVIPLVLAALFLVALFPDLVYHLPLRFE